MLSEGSEALTLQELAEHRQREAWLEGGHHVPGALHGYQREVRNCPGAENRVSIVPYLYVQWDGDNSTSLVKASRVSVRRDAQKWLDLRARVEANRSATGASSAFEVDAVVVAVRNAAKAGYDGLLGTLLEADTVDAFGTPICSILIDYKWNKFARTYFMVRLFMRLFHGLFHLRSRY